MRKIVTLVITQSCNLSCSYCYQSHKSANIMSFETAKDAINKHIRDSDNFDEIEIDLFGGEPFLRPDFIKEICEWTWSQRYNKPIIFFISTNGTLVHGEIQDWLRLNNAKICLGLSLDGASKTHDLNRSNSYSLIDIDFFIKTYPYQPVRMTITPESISNLHNDITFLHSIGFKVTASLAQGVKWDIKKNKNQFANELKKLSIFYANNPEVEVCSLFDMYLPIIPYNLDQKKWCGCGNQMVTVNFDGTEFPCQLFLSLSMPENTNTSGINFIDEAIFRDKKCYDCVIKSICPTCYGMNLIKRDSISNRDDNMCELYKIQALANSYLSGIQIKKNIKKFNNAREMIDTINSIKLIQNHLLNIN